MLFMLCFLFKQTWGIPGALLINIIGGAIYGVWALPLASFLAATGSTLAYYISREIIGPIIIGSCISRQSLRTFKAAVEGKNVITLENHENLLSYMITIRYNEYLYNNRVVPLIPGWFVNLVAPFSGKIEIYIRNSRNHLLYWNFHWTYTIPLYLYISIFNFVRDNKYT
jgi:uncharacterized membrane protein YdjX (TVP38/TMEM64 family)